MGLPPTPQANCTHVQFIQESEKKNRFRVFFLHPFLCAKLKSCQSEKNGKIFFDEISLLSHARTKWLHGLCTMYYASKFSILAFLNSFQPGTTKSLPLWGKLTRLPEACIQLQAFLSLHHTIYFAPGTKTLKKD